MCIDEYFLNKIGELLQEKNSNSNKIYINLGII